MTVNGSPCAVAVMTRGDCVATTLGLRAGALEAACRDGGHWIE